MPSVLVLVKSIIVLAGFILGTKKPLQVEAAFTCLPTTYLKLIVTHGYAVIELRSYQQSV